MPTEVTLTNQWEVLYLYYIQSSNQVENLIEIFMNQSVINSDKLTSEIFVYNYTINLYNKYTTLLFHIHLLQKICMYTITVYG